METQTMTIHRALSELKLIDAKINRKTAEINPVGIYQKDKLINNYITKEDFSKEATSSLQSVFDLLNRKVKLKSAIVEANSKTKVKVNGVQMSIADAINQKTIIQFKRTLLEYLKNKHNSVVADLNNKNTIVDQNIQRILEATFGKDNVKVGSSDVEAVQKPYIEANQLHLFDPLNIKDVIKNLEDEINGFESEVDAVLSEINAITLITI